MPAANSDRDLHAGHPIGDVPDCTLHGVADGAQDSLLNGADFMLVALDARGRIVYSNRACDALTTLSAGERRGRYFWELAASPGDAGGVEKMFRDAWSGPVGPPVPCQWELRGDPTRVIAWSCKRLESASGQPEQVLFTGVDVTERLQLEEALRQSDEEYRLVLNHISDAVFITDEAGVLTFICPNVEVIFGYAYEEVRARGTIRDLLGVDRFDAAELNRSGEIQNVDWEVVDKQGRTHILLVNVKRVAIRNGTLLYTCRDVTARRQMEESLREYQQELAHATRLSTIGEMTSGLAHELNQPLSAISNYAQACVRKIDAGRCPTVELRAPLEQIARQSHRAAEIIRRLRAFTGKRKPQRSAVDLDQVLRDSIELLAPLARKHGLDVRHEWPADLPRVLADPTGVQQVLINLLRNAFEAMIEVHTCPGTVWVTAEVERPGEVEVRVHDEGLALSDDALDRIFDPFYSTKRDGMGLGLSISRSIIESHGGRLWAARNLDRGNTFLFTLPAAGGPERAGPRPGPRSP